MGIPGGWRYDTPGGGWESEWNDAQSRGAVGGSGNVTYYRSGNGSEFALDYETDTSVAGWGSRGIPPQYANLLASAGDRQRGLLHGRNINFGAPAAAPAPAAPVIVAKPAEEFQADDYRKPAQEGAVKAPGYQIDSRASAYERWLANPGSDGRSADSETPSFGGGGGDRVRFYQEKLESEQPDATVAGRYSEGGGGERRMAGSRMFKERLNRYRM